MGKAEAKKRADAGGISIAELRAMIVSARGRGGPCRINAQLTHEHACDIFWRALEGRADDEVPKTLTPDIYRAGRMRATRDHLTICNILRCCA